MDNLDGSFTEPHPLAACILPLNMKENYFPQVCKKVLGQTPVQCLVSRRMFEAVRLLAEGKLNVVEIAYKIGYESHVGFDHAFKRFTGLSPSEYRKRLPGQELTFFE